VEGEHIGGKEVGIIIGRNGGGIVYKNKGGIQRV